MSDGQVGVPEGHARSAIAHDTSYLFTHLGSKAVGGAAGARGLARAEGTSIYALARVLEKCGTVLAKPTCGSCVYAAGIRVTVSAVHVDHQLDGALLSTHSP